MACTDYERHEQLVSCTHRDCGTEIAVKVADGCSGRLCQGCDAQLGVRRWPDLVERIAGPSAGLDALELMRVLGQLPRDKR